MKVRINGTVIGTAQTTSGAAWTRFFSSWFATASGQSYTLSLVGSATTDQTAFIDEVISLSDNETQTYTYDALGRLTKSVIIGGPNSGISSAACFDPAGNRSRYFTGTSLNPDCGNSSAQVMMEGSTADQIEDESTPANVNVDPDSESEGNSNDSPTAMGSNSGWRL